jgi:hypothetical protein
VVIQLSSLPRNPTFSKLRTSYSMESFRLLHNLIILKERSFIIPGYIATSTRSYPLFGENLVNLLMRKLIFDYSYDAQYVNRISL